MRFIILFFLSLQLQACEYYLIQAQQLYAEASWYNDHNQSISEYNTLQRVKYFMDKYYKCKEHLCNNQ